MFQVTNYVFPKFHINPFSRYGEEWIQTYSLTNITFFKVILVLLYSLERYSTLICNSYENVKVRISSATPWHQPKHLRLH